MAVLQETRDKADGLVAELEVARQVVETSDNDMGEALELTDVLAKEEEVAGLVK